MKNITLKILSILLLTLFVPQIQAQEYGEWTQPGKYTIGVPGQDLFMTINGSTGALEWAAKLPGDDPTQVWAIVDHVSPASNGYMQITASIPNVGNFTMGTTPENVSGKDITLTVRAGDPISDSSDAAYHYDQFQRRKTATSQGGNDALFIKVPDEGGSRYGVIPSAAGDPVQFDGGGIDKLEFTLVETLSTKEFDTSSVFISNPVNNELIIKGLTSNVNGISVYSLLGQKVIKREVNAESTLSLNVSALTSGIYLVELKGENGSFTKKIVKQ